MKLRLLLGAAAALVLVLYGPGCSLERVAVGGGGGADGGDAGGIDAGDAGVCVPAGDETCNERDDDCDGTVDEGFELGSDLANCGRCGNACTVGARATPACTSGVCVLTCDATFADCNGDPADGCEASLGSATTCGSCVTVCEAATPLCEAQADGTYRCTDMCSGSTEPCGASCVDTQTSPSHCGGCDMACPARASSIASCSGGDCEYVCADGFASCDSMDDNGCETSTRTTTDCGDCDAPCGFANATASCATGTCAFVSCDTGFADCDSSFVNGCETRTNTLADCGGCGVACALPNAAASCATGTCELTDCAPGFANCDLSPANGCEVDVTTTSNCASCGTICAAGERCGPTGCVSPTAVVQVAVGSNFSCARIGDGRVYCWGANGSGQLGDGTTSPRRTAVQVMGVTDAIDIAAGELHACAVRAAGGAVVCWGENSRNQTAAGGTGDHMMATAAGGGVVGAAQVTAGNEHTCARRTSGAIVCWGRNNKGQLGTADGGGRENGVDVPGIGDGAWVSAGFEHTCVARSDGRVWCWGENGDRQLGDGGTGDRSTPLEVMMLVDAARIDAGFAFNCALRRAGGGIVACWGDNANGQLTGGGTTDSSMPLSVAGLTSPVSVTAGAQHACARLVTNAVMCWGAGGGGRLGDGTTSQSDVPVAVTGLMNATQVSAGGSHTCAARADGTAVCWGVGSDGRLGNDDTADQPTFVTVMGLP